MSKQDIVNPGQMMQTWLNLMTEVMRGSADARDTMRTITGSAVTPDEMLRVMTRFMPAGIGPVQARAFNESLEEYWRMMGVVPRHRYLELLERNEQLRRQLEDAEQTIQQLRPMGGAMVPQEEAQRVFDMWGTMIQESMKVQQEFLRAWAPGASATSSSSSDEPPAEPAQEVVEPPAEPEKPTTTRSRRKT